MAGRADVELPYCNNDYRRWVQIRDEADVLNHNEFSDKISSGLKPGRGSEGLRPFVASAGTSNNNHYKETTNDEYYFGTYLLYLRPEYETYCLLFRTRNPTVLR